MIILMGGPSGSGKTTTLNDLTKHFKAQGKKVIGVSLDNFYRDFSSMSLSEREAVNFDHTDSVDKDYLKQVVTSILKRESFQMPEYDFVTHTRKADTKEVNPANADVVIMEGIFGLNPALDLINLIKLHGEQLVCVYVDTHKGLCAARRFNRDLLLGRDREYIYKQYTEVVVKMQEDHVEKTKRFANVTMRNNDLPKLIADINTFLTKQSAKEVAPTGWYGAFTTYAAQKLEGWEDAATKKLESWESVIDKMADKVLGPRPQPEGEVPPPSTQRSKL